jgi:S1-C subfamily serine protease
MSLLPLRLRGTVPVIALALAVALTSVGASPAEALSPARQGTPVLAGSVIRYDATGFRCTAGAVLKSRAVTALVTQAGVATRYVLTAKHCGGLHSAVTLGGTVRGTVTWVSPDLDLALITVPPAVQRVQRCTASSLGPVCYIANAYTPLAVGRVVLFRPGAPTETDIPMRDPAAPYTGSETFCSSGATTGALCVFSLSRGRRTAPPSGRDGTIFAMSDSAHQIAAGDSGGPVVAADGSLYGIIAGGAADPSTYYMAYTPIHSFLAEQPYYGIAPS